MILVESLFHTIVTGAWIFALEKGKPVDVSKYAISLEVASEPLSEYNATALKELPE
jgi:hypothetical protein